MATALDDLIASIQRALLDGPPLRLAVLFGSFATGRQHPNSDLDVAILPSDAELPLRYELRLAASISRATGREVDLVRLDRSPAALRWHAARDGVLLHGDPAELLRFRVAAATEHADMARLTLRPGQGA